MDGSTGKVACVRDCNDELGGAAYMVGCVALHRPAGQRAPDPRGFQNLAGLFYKETHFMMKTYLTIILACLPAGVVPAAAQVQNLSCGGPRGWHAIGRSPDPFHLGGP
ncbi:MAG: hypothetical protein B6245_02660 [Desulfobacteraceae bacterium 4572_88]|nr:MAG: hypothetical protein B6245_02660 [Desulfobacteraceae bacterium 4572_88]